MTIFGLRNTRIPEFYSFRKKSLSFSIQDGLNNLVNKRTIIWKRCLGWLRKCVEQSQYMLSMCMCLSDNTGISTGEYFFKKKFAHQFSGKDFTILGCLSLRTYFPTYLFCTESIPWDLLQMKSLTKPKPFYNPSVHFISIKLPVYIHGKFYSFIYMY